MSLCPACGHENPLSFYRSVGATRYVHQGDALMAADARQRGRA